jgi:hypothetical protein
LGDSAEQALHLGERTDFLILEPIPCYCELIPCCR